MNLIRKFLDNYNVIEHYYDYLVQKTKQHEFVGVINEWLIDNFYLLAEHKNNILHDKKGINKYKKLYISLYPKINEIVVKNNYVINFKVLKHELKKYQRTHKMYFTYNEIESIKDILIFIYFSRLRTLCEEEYAKLLDKEEINKIVLSAGNKELSLDDFISSKKLEDNYHYIFELNYRLKELGSKSNKLFKELNKILEQNNISLKEIINDEYQNKMENDILVTNIFNDLKEFTDFDIEDIFEQISLTEKLFLTDEIYNKMTVESKVMYRRQLKKLARKNHTGELECLQKLFKKATGKDYHVGFHLFKEKNYTINTIFYMTIAFIITVIVDYFISDYFLPNKIISFIILYIPINQLLLKIENEILSKVVRPKQLPKLDFSEGIPEDEPTMVVIPTIVSNTQKIKEMFDLLETYYIMNNKTDNLYFTLLGDIKSSQKEIEDYDKEVSEYGVEYAKKLNKKYDKNLFYYIYRKRKYNDKEGEYLGYERKRGALLQFNKILLGEMDKVTNNEYFNTNMLLNNDLNIKYVITLDTDTKFVLNTALNLVGAMAHPLNKPILNKKQTKVIKGYGIMQPRCSTDIEDTNKSLYSQIFAGVGGFDTYSAVVPNVYFDNFGEGSFVGKGIYDLKTFDTVLYNTFPDNKILSHDLLEGNYLRCAYVNDIELMDGFPSKFLSDMSRHHRWARGDAQIIGWIFTRIKNKRGEKIKNPISLIGKYKILDNIIRMFLQPSLLLILLLGIMFSKYYILWILFVVLELFLPIVFFLRSKKYKEERNITTIYYKNLFYGGKSVLLRSYIELINLPYSTRMYMDAFFRTMYRLLISHKNLLNWITADEAEKTIKDTLGNYVRNYLFNIFLGILCIIYFGFTLNIAALIVGISFILAPLILYRVSRDIDFNKIELNDKEISKVQDMAYRSFLYFKENIKEEYNYLIPDNYQENREEKIDLRTSPTAIAYSLLSFICADELEFIKTDEAITTIRNILESINSLKKWHGHLYNWYSITNKEVIQPYFVSTVDSGNLMAALIVVKEYLNKHNATEEAELCTKLIENTNFRKLYTKNDVFSIGFDELEGKLSSYNYNKFASESRLISYIAIAYGYVPNKHWFALDKSLTTYHGRKGLISWSGTAFEYFMPYLFMKSYPNTLLDESYEFAKYCNKEYIENINKSLPWGISESAYNELDNSLNYKYKAFATPYLKAKEDQDNRIVLSPYSSLMIMDMAPTDVYKNMNKFKKLEMYARYGFYDAYDYDNTGVVKSFYAHHVGMSLVGLTNYLKQDAIKEYFHNDINIKTFDILLKEKIQLRTSIDMKMAKYKKYNYEKEEIQNDIRAFNYISYMPEVSVLSNKKYCLVMNDRGNSFSRYRTIQLNRYRKVTEQDYGLFLYIKDLDTDYIWSNTYAPLNTKPDKYEVIFASDKIKYMRKDRDISTKTEIVITKEHHSEIRKITFINDSDEFKHLELTSYLEPTLCENMQDISHRVFSSMFLSSSYDLETNTLIMKRKSRDDNNSNYYMFTRLVVPNSEEAYTYDTERIHFIGRNHTTTDPIGLNKPLTNYIGDNLDPIMSMRNSIVIPPNGSVEVYLHMGFGRSKEQILEIIHSYDREYKVDRAFEVSNLMNLINTKNMQLTGQEMRTFNIMLNYLYQTTRISVNEERQELLRKNALGQSGLWKFGISGDRPIILVEISDISDLDFIYEILKCFEYYKNNSIFVDIIIVNNENTQYKKIIDKEIENELYRIYTVNSFYHTPGQVKVIDSENITREEKTLLNIVPRLKFIIKNHITLKDSVIELQKNNKITNYEKVIYEENIKVPVKDKLTFDNGYGGFIKSGKEYLIYNRNTPQPWSNVIANDTFGTVITNNGCGFTYAYNSGEYKITSWTNDVICNDKSEGFRFNGKTFDPDKCIHGFGYSILSSETKELKHSITEFVPLKDNIKIYLMELTNKTSEKQAIDIDFYINPTLGNFEEKTARHILSEFMGDDNYMKLRNVYSINYGDVNVFMSSNQPIINPGTERMLTKSITNKIELDKHETTTIIYLLGSSMNDKGIKALLKEYTDITNVKRALRDVKASWKKDLSTITVKSNDTAFDYMINGWYLYQTISARILAKTGFYQVSGAFGYRDQLQDAMNIAMIKPDFTRKQILLNAAHQFEEGDVLHWWHEKNRFGLRSRYKDDYLWLVHATIFYINITGDKSILNAKIPYIIGDSLRDYESERGIIFNYSKKEGTLLEHIEKSLKLSMNSLGRHKIPLMGGGDWNDGLNKVGIKGKGESVWLGFFLHEIINDFLSLAKEFKLDIETDKYESFNEKLKDNLNKKAWDGQWYLRAFYDNGDKLGSKDNNECKIDLISQSFSILSDVVSREQREVVINSVEQYLVDPKAKLIKLLTPPFHKTLNNPGYIMNYPRGVRENGGQYTHSVSWYLIALIKSGYSDRAYNYYQMINPINRSLDEDSVQQYKVEPYVLAADIYSATGREGRGGWTWYTGSAGWFYKVGIMDILGLQKHGDKLVLSPHIPVRWDNFRLSYNYMDTEYNIEIIKGNKEELIFDGKVQKNNEIDLKNDKETHEITLYLKRRGS